MIRSINNLLVVALATTGTAAGEKPVAEVTVRPPDSAPVKEYSELDTNHDNFLSASEAQASAPLIQWWDQLDRNDDDRLSREEYTHFRFRQVFGQLDKDRDGQLKREEVGNMPALTDRWMNIDLNQNGQLDQTEFIRFELAPLPEPKP